MFIRRNGKDIELTAGEMIQAYEEQKHIYDRQDIIDNLDWILEGIRCGQAVSCSLEELQKNDAFVTMAARISREKQDNEDISFIAAIQQGVRMALREVQA